jgi:tetratricopeptide (TPR) repeat protein
MKQTFTAFCLLIVQASFAQECKTIAANKASTYEMNYQSFSNTVSPQKPASWDITRMKPRLAKVESWMRGMLTGFTGAKLLYGNYYSLDPLDFAALDNSVSRSDATLFYQATGIKGFYAGKLMFFAYYCYDNNNKVFTEVESGSNIRVVFNNVFASQLCSDAGLFTINGKFAFKKLEKSRSEGRVDFYEMRAKSNVYDTTYTSKHDFIIIRNSDKPVFIPITRKEYLEQMLKDIEIYKAKRKNFLTVNYENLVKNFEAEMKAYKTSDKSYTPEKEAKRRKWFNEDNNPEKSAKDLKKLEDEVNGARQIIAEYLDKPKEWLSRGFSSFYNWSFENYYPPGVKKYFDDMDVFSESREDYTRSEIVSINPAYFNKELSRDVPQLILVNLVKGRYPHMLKVAALVKKPGALAPLEAILNPGKATSPDIVPPELISTYTLKYLPKLTKLTPLTVPAGMKPSVAPVVNNYNSNVPTAKFNFEIPPSSPKLSQLPQLLTNETYKTYIQQLHIAISNAIKPEEKKKADDYIKNKKLTTSKDISSIAFAAWLQKTPRHSLYLFNKAIVTDPADALAANNFSSFLIMGGLPEKAVPILEYWNKQKPGEATLLCNLGNAYYRLGDIDKSMKYLQQCVQYDTLNPTANKLLCMIYLKKGDVKKAEDHGTKSLTSSHDEQVIAILRQVNNKVKPGEIMSRLHKKEFPMLKRTMLPAMPSNLDDMAAFAIDLETEKRSLALTIQSIEAKMPAASDDVQQKMMMASFAGGISPIRIKAQFIIMDAMQIYHTEKVRESDAFKHHLKNLSGPYNITVKAISKKYADKLNKLEGGEAGDEDQISALELARCKEINAETEKYLAVLSPLVNQYAQRQEFISRKFYRDYANWSPYWIPAQSLSFLSIERDYLKDIANILSEYRLVSKSDCSIHEPKPLVKDGILKEWEDEYCANFKGKIGMGPVKLTWTCSSWGVEGGEGIVGEFEVNYADDGSFEDFTFGGGLGATWQMGNDKTVKLEAGASAKEFIKVGFDKTTGMPIVKDVGYKTDVSVEGSIGSAAIEVKILELSVAANAGVKVEGAVVPIFNLK